MRKVSFTTVWASGTYHVHAELYPGAPGTRWAPEEVPEIEFMSIVDLATGNEVGLDALAEAEGAARGEPDTTSEHVVLWLDCDAWRAAANDNDCDDGAV